MASMTTMQRWFAVRLAAFVIFSMALQGIAFSEIEIHVSPTGNDRNPGTASRPLATLEAARAAVRKQRASGTMPQPVTVLLHSGTYLRSQSFVLKEEDSGSSGASVTYRSAPGETARIVGGFTLASGALRPVKDASLLARMTPSARGHVYAAQIEDAGLRDLHLPDIFLGNGGLFRLVMDGKVLPLSRWPDQGYTTMERVIDSGIQPKRGGTFVYRPEVAAHVPRWMDAARNGKLWLTGFWRVPFEVESVRVASMDASNSTITLAAPVPNGIGSKYGPTVNGNRTGDGKEQYYASNLLEEIDRPGEWSFDIKTHTLYVWPPETGKSPQQHEWLLASLRAPVIQLMGASNVILRSLVIEGGTQQGIQIEGGHQDVVAGCTLRNIGGGAVNVEGGDHHRIQSNDMAHLGDYGIHLVGGDRARLVPAEHVADNNHIAFIGEEARITDGIFLDGVGNTATHNLIHDASYNGIRYQGNDQRMAFNEIHHVGLDAGDLGVFYTNGDWAAQGNRVEYNFGHHSPNAHGSYIDDGASGRTTRGNIFYKLASGIFMGGGHNNLIVDNLIVACKLGIHVDDRGVVRKYDETAPHLTRFLKTINVNSPPWSTRYPNFLHGIVEDPIRPTNNTFVENALVSDGIPYQLRPDTLVDRNKNPVIGGDAKFRNTSLLDFRLDKDSAVLVALPGFKVSAPETFGLYKDSYRGVLPSDDETGRFADRSAPWSFDSNVDVKASDKTGVKRP